MAIEDLKPRHGRRPGKGKPSKKGSLTRPLTPAQEHFIQAYMVRNSAAAAYRDSHPKCSWSTADTEGPRLYKDPRVSSAIKRLLAKRAQRLAANARKIDEALAAKAFASISDVYDQHGAIMEPHQMPREVALAVRRLKRTEIVNKTGPDGEPELVGHTVELEMWDAVPALRALGERLGLFNAQPVQTIGTGFAALLEAAGQRALEATRRQMIEGRAETVVDAVPDPRPAIARAAQ